MIVLTNGGEKQARIAQLDRVSPSEGEGPRFESWCEHHRFFFDITNVAMATSGFSARTAKADVVPMTICRAAEAGQTGQLRGFQSRRNSCVFCGRYLPQPMSDLGTGDRAGIILRLKTLLPC